MNLTPSNICVKSELTSFFPAHHPLHKMLPRWMEMLGQLKQEEQKTPPPEMKDDSLKWYVNMVSQGKQLLKQIDETIIDLCIRLFAQSSSEFESQTQYCKILLTHHELACVLMGRITELCSQINPWLQTEDRQNLLRSLTLPSSETSSLRSYCVTLLRDLDDVWRRTLMWVDMMIKFFIV